LKFHIKIYKDKGKQGKVKKLVNFEKLRNDLEKIEFGDHLACIYKNKKEQPSIAIPFLLTGLQKNEKCMYIVDENTKQEIIEAFTSAVDMKKYRKGQFEVLAKEEAYLKGGFFSPEKMIELLRQNEAKALTEGYSGLRVTGEMTWIFSKLPGVERFIEYEAQLNYFFPGRKCTALCQYNEKKFSPEILLDVIRTHPKIIIYDTVCENLHYLPPEEFFARIKGEIQWNTYEKVRNDIVNRERMRKKIEKNEREKDLILESMSEYVIYFGADKKITWANKAAAESAHKNPEDLVGKRCYTVWHDRDEPCIPCPVYRAWESGNHEEEEITLPDGRIWYVKANPVYENGGITGIVMTARDTTGQNRAEDALKWELAVDNALSKVYNPLISPSSSIEDITKVILDQARSLTKSEHGYVSSIDALTKDSVAHTLTEMLKDQCKVSGKHRRITFPRGENGLYGGLWGYSLNELEAFFTNSPETHPASTGAPHGHIPIKRFLSVPVLVNGELVGQIALANKATDYTEKDLIAIRRLADTYALAIQRMRAEENLRESEEKFRGIAERNFDIIYELDLDGRVTYVSPAIERVTGYTPEEIVGKTFKDFIPELLVPDVLRAHMDVVKGGSLEALQIKIKRKDGSLASVEINTSPIFKEGKVVKTQGVARDITERKRTEIQLRSLFEASRLINSTMDTEKILKFISDSIQKMVGFDSFIIFLVTEDRKNVYSAYVSGEVKKLMKKLVFSYSEGLLGECMQSEEPILVKNARTEKEISSIHMKSLIIVPLIMEGECAGALHISRRVPLSYDEQDVAVLKPLSEVITSALENSHLHNKIKEFSLELERRVEEKSKRTEIILDAKQSLQQERSWEKGLITIVGNMSRLGFERCGVFLVNSLTKTLNYHFGKGIEIPEEGLSIPLTDTDYFGVKCVLEKRTILIKEYNPKEGKQISESESFVWIPIIVQNEAFAALAADNKESKRVITEEDVEDLEMLAGMCAAFIDRTRVLLEPVAEKKLKTELKTWLDSAKCYVILEKKPKKSFGIFVDLVTHGIPGFAISREHPEKLKRKYTLVRTPLMWLSRTEMENTINPDDLSKLMYVVGNFTRKSEESVILLDGVEYLISQTSFKNVLGFLQELKDIIIKDNSRLIIPLHRETRSLEEYSTFEREFTIIDTGVKE
jgi:PAS domain S-box-containing protein